MSTILTPAELSELTGLLLQEVGNLSLKHEQGTLTAYGYQRMDALTALYQKLNGAAQTVAPVDPNRQQFRKAFDIVFGRYFALPTDNHVDFVYDMLYTNHSKTPKLDAAKYLRQYTGLPLSTAMDGVTKVLKVIR